MSWKSLLHLPGWEEWLLQGLCSTWQEGWEQWVIYSLSSSSLLPVEQTHGMHVAVKSWIPPSATVCQYLQSCNIFLAFSSSTIKSVTSSTCWGTATSTEHRWEKKCQLLVEGQSTRVLLTNLAAPQLVQWKCQHTAGLSSTASPAGGICSLCHPWGAGEALQGSKSPTHRR